MERENSYIRELVRKVPNKGETDNLKLNADMKVLANGLVKTLPLILKKLLVEAKLTNIQNRSIRDNLHCMRYTVDRIDD